MKAGVYIDFVGNYVPVFQEMLKHRPRDKIKTHANGVSYWQYAHLHELTVIRLTESPLLKCCIQYQV